MLTVINTQKFSTWRNLKNVMQDRSRARTPSTIYTFYQDETPVAEMTIFIAGNAQLNYGGDVLILRRAKCGFFTQEWRLEGNGKPVATASTSPMYWLTKCWINHRNRGSQFELTLRTNPWSFRGGQFRVLQGGSRIGIVLRKGNDAIIDVPDEIPVPVQVFMFRLAKALWASGTD